MICGGTPVSKKHRPGAVLERTHSTFNALLKIYMYIYK